MMALVLRFAAGLSIVAGLTLAPSVADLLNETRPFAVLPADAFEALGWDLPESGQTVKTIADVAPGGAFDPRQLERASGLGYRAAWHVVRYRYYGLDWDISGLRLTPDKPDPALPTIAIVHGGSANWYEFFLDPLNRAGLGQYVAQRSCSSRFRAITELVGGPNPSSIAARRGICSIGRSAPTKPVCAMPSSRSASPPKA
jgi:hypothetical protein